MSISRERPMSDIPHKELVSRRPATGTGAMLFTLGGVAAAFGVASCCALPLLLTTIGVSTAWLGGGAVLWWRQQRAAATCGPGGLCAPPLVRALTLGGLLVGALLLWAGYT